jgi:hypothetical protein
MLRPIEYWRDIQLTEIDAELQVPIISKDMNSSKC